MRDHRAWNLSLHSSPVGEDQFLDWIDGGVGADRQLWAARTTSKVRTASGSGWKSSLTGDTCCIKVNGAVVDEAFEAKPDFGMLLQTEQAEMFVRRCEPWPLGKTPTDELKQ